ncbi:hypothetical protein [Nocardia terpenica]|uniref:hypothetical protein n=1 Tax=Nocardia terpenica TaxID=455432 RepID=UPI0012FE1E3B|nr:hypothetical protein [Nocardia terpenica]
MWPRSRDRLEARGTPTAAAGGLYRTLADLLKPLGGWLQRRDITVVDSDNPAAPAAVTPAEVCVPDE